MNRVRKVLKFLGTPERLLASEEELGCMEFEFSHSDQQVKPLCWRSTHLADIITALASIYKEV
jgi:hypothetical protein